MNQRRIKQVYGKSARKYDEIMARYWPVDRKAFVEGLGIKSGDRVLVAAVGTGLDLEVMPKDADVIGVDITKEMLDEARKKKSKANVRLEQMDIYDLPFERRSFDYVVSNFTLCVLDEPRRALGELLRVTKRSGKLGILDYCASNNPETRKWQELFQHHAANIGFPEGVIVWNSLMDYDALIRNPEVARHVESYERYENPNPFLTCCKLILRKAGK